MNKRSKEIILLAIIIAAALLAGFFDYKKELFGRGFRLGLDLVGGTYLIYQIDLSEVASSDHSSVIEGLRDVMERRVNVFGVSEPQIYTTQTKGGANLTVELAGIKNVNEAINQIGRTAALDFRETVNEDKLEFTTTNLTGRYLKKASAILDSTSGFPQISLQFSSDGSKIFEELTGSNIGKPLAIFLDNQLISSPRVSEKIVGGQAVITGQFTLTEARQLASLLNAGALPAPINLITQQTIGAALGQHSLQKSIYAGLIGTLLIIIFMIVYYRLLGVFASAALIIYIVFLLFIFKLTPIFTLTLSGIAGILLSIGMAVDANILIFERTKEELKRGLSRPAAIEEGFKRAWSSIRDSNLTTIISSIILYYFTSSFVKGFALTMLIGVAVSMFSAITVSRLLLKVFIRK